MKSHPRDGDATADLRQREYGFMRTNAPGRDKGAVCKYVRRVLSKSAGEKEADNEGRFTGATDDTLVREEPRPKESDSDVQDIDLAAVTSRGEGANETTQWN